MGVLACSRKECDNIMCRTYITSVGYICDDCQIEFKDYLKSKGIVPMTEHGIISSLKIFLHTTEEYNYIESNYDYLDNFFKQNTDIGWD